MDSDVPDVNNVEEELDVPDRITGRFSTVADRHRSSQFCYVLHEFIKQVPAYFYVNSY